MRSWQEHYVRAEQFAEKAMDPNTSLEQRKLWMQQAQVEATLAQVRLTPYTGSELPPLYGH